MNIHEELFARTFIVPEKRERYLSLLGSKKGRKKLLNGFNHISDLDTRYATTIASNQQSAESIVKILVGRGALESCYVMSDDAALDQKEMTLKDAIWRVEGSNIGTFVSCIAGKLGYFETENATFRYILEA